MKNADVWHYDCIGLYGSSGSWIFEITKLLMIYLCIKIICWSSSGY